MPFSFLFVSKGAWKTFSAELFASQASDDMFMAWRDSCSGRSNLKPFFQKFSEVEMFDAVVIVASEQWGHGDDVLWVVVIDGSEITKLPFSCSHVGYDVGGLHIDTLSIGLGAYEVDFTSLQLTYIHLIPQADKMLIDDVLNHFFYVTLSCSTSQSVADAIVLEVKLIVGLEDSFAMNVKSVHLVQNVCLAKERDVIDDDSRGDGFTLRFHILGDAVGGDEFARIIGKETNEIFQEWHISYPVSHDDILQQYRVEYVHLIFTGIVFFQSDFCQARQTAILYVFGERIIVVW